MEREEIVIHVRRPNPSTCHRLDGHAPASSRDAAASHVPSFAKTTLLFGAIVYRFEMRALRPFLSVVAFLGVSAICSLTQATFSIVATEPSTGMIGSAGASCVPYEVIRILAIAEGKGLLVAQANFDDNALATGQAMIATNELPETVLATITDPMKFPMAPKMQYGIVDIAGNTASYTGSEALAYAGDKAGEYGGIAFTVQGNILTGANVLDQMNAAMAEGCDLPERILRGIEAASLQGGGDSRCTDGGISAASAYISIEQKGQTILRISLPDLRPNDPVAELRSQFDSWRSTHPCPVDSGQTMKDNPEISPGCSVGRTMPTEHVPFGLLLMAGVLARLRLSQGRRVAYARIESRDGRRL